MSEIPVAIVGPTGYTGLELLEILARHPRMKVAYLATARDQQPRIEAEFPRLSGRLGAGVDGRCRPIDHAAIAEASRLAFLCLPHDAAMRHAPELLKRGVKVVDLSAAYRIRDTGTYERAYGHAHVDRENLARAVYGLTEVERARVRGATLVANPGCYPTAAGLGLLPFVRAGVIEPGSIVVNAASGASGAGREAKSHLTLVEAGASFSAYGVGVHRHQPEIEQTLAASAGSAGAGSVLFVPHLLPIERGILATMYARPRGALTPERARAIVSEAYAGEAFVRVREQAPTLRDVQRTNQCDVWATVAGGWLVVIAAIDNLVKGASGQAVQNANVMLGLEETAGLS
ncbi:MAG: N-acetyl-gamma-glutamyl-phosphate reductase [Phycisphaerales bacterium]